MHPAAHPTPPLLRLALPGALLLCLGCPPMESDPFASPPSPADVIEPGDGGGIVGVGPEAPPCEQAAVGMRRLAEDAQARGVNAVLDDPADAQTLTRFDHGGRIVISDLDDDGDDDLLFGMSLSGPMLYANDGGSFTLQPLGPSRLELPASVPEWVSLAAVDLDDDGLPEIVAGGPWEVVSWPNQGDLRFGSPRTLHRIDPGPKVLISMTSFGDADGDGDLDAYITTDGIQLDAQGQGLPPGVPDALLLGRGDGTFDPPIEMKVGNMGGSSLVSGFIDVDGDGAMEIMAAASGASVPPTAVWQRDPSDGTWSDIAASIGMDWRFAAMGFDGADLNGDQVPDLCFTDVGAPRCLLTDAQDGPYEGGAALGLAQGDAAEQVGWSFEIADLDNDGREDVLQASGPAMSMDPSNGDTSMPDLLWVGRDDGRFVDATDESGFGSDGNHLGVATADLDGDGWLEIVLAGPGERPLLYGNRCGSGHWLEVEFEGPSGNVQGFGTRATVVAGERSWTRTLHASRGPAQGPARLHFGLGDAAAVDAVVVAWPNGLRTVVRDVPISRRVTIAAP
mgnify:CR=1 FL=1